MTPDRLDTILGQFPRKRLLVIGDLILDEFIWGRVRRISPEAPVPIVEVERETYYPGGAANVARNLREFDVSTAVLGMLGPHAQADRLLRLLKEREINTDCVLQIPDFQTIVKTRIIARHQQIVRVDREKKRHLTGEQRADALDRLAKALPELDAIILEDYGKGLLDQPTVDAILRLAREAGVLIALDPTPSNPLAWRGVHAITPNRLEAFSAAGEPWAEPVDPPPEDAALRRVGRTLLEQWECAYLLITLSEQGMMLFRPDSAPYHLPTRAREVFDVSGAGDTSIALFTLGLVSGATPEEAADLANHAGGVVVGKLGTATLDPAELRASFAQHHGG